MAKTLTVTQLQDQIFAREGFRVSFQPLGASNGALPAYEYRVMAPNGWHVSDWQRVRLAPYIPYFKGLTVYRGDGSPLKSDIRLGRLRDTYYEAEYGSLEPATDTMPARIDQPTSLAARRNSRRDRSGR